MNIYNILLVGGGGFLGSVARYVSVHTIDSRLNNIFPFGTITVNVIGSLILGVIYGWSVKHGGQHAEIRLFLITGFCGGFTTFSAFAFENMNLFQQKFALVSIGYIVGSLLLGILAVIGGIAIGKSI